MRAITLGEFGARLETEVHDALHMRWAKAPTERRPPPNGIDGIDPMWDDPSYDYLGDSYSAHVNPVFWKLHIWVDDRIEDWRTANELDRIDWKGTWVGPGHDHGEQDNAKRRREEHAEARVLAAALAQETAPSESEESLARAVGAAIERNAVTLPERAIQLV